MDMHVVATGEEGALVSWGPLSNSSGPNGGLSLQTSTSACPTHVSMVCAGTWPVPMPANAPLAAGWDPLAPCA